MSKYCASIWELLKDKRVKIVFDSFEKARGHLEGKTIGIDAINQTVTAPGASWAVMRREFGKRVLGLTLCGAKLVAFIDGDARRALRARLTRTNLREARAAIPGEGHLRAEVRTGASEALADVRAMDLHGGLFGHVDAGATDDGVRRGIETLERDIADVVRSFGKTCGETSAVVQVSLLRKTLCSKYHVDWVPLRAMVTYFGDGTEVLSAAASDAITRARALGPFAEDLAKSLAAATAVSKSCKSGECDVVLMKGERWPGNAGRAIVHRSPDVDGDAGEWRLCVRVDAPRWVNPATNE